MTNALQCFELAFTARTPKVDGACHSNLKQLGTERLQNFFNEEDEPFSGGVAL